VASIHRFQMDSLRHGFKAFDFNAAIPDIIHDKVAERQKVNFVDMTSLTVNDISSPPMDEAYIPL